MAHTNTTAGISKLVILEFKIDFHLLLRSAFSYGYNHRKKWTKLSTKSVQWKYILNWRSNNEYIGIHCKNRQWYLNFQKEPCHFFSAVSRSYILWGHTFRKIYLYYNQFPSDSELFHWCFFLMYKSYDKMFG